VLGTGGATLTTCLKLSDRLDDVIHFGLLGKIALPVTLWCSAMRHHDAEQECLHDGFEARCMTEGGTMRDWWVDVAVWVIVGLKGHVMFDVHWLHQ